MNDAKYTVRPAEPRDAERIRQLLEQICLLHVEGRPDLFRPSGKYTVDDIIKMIDDPGRPILVADVGADVAGYVFCQLNRRKNPVMWERLTLYVDDLCVDQKYRRCGIGRALFQGAQRLARECGAYNIELNVWAFNESAIAFYRSLGMKPSRMIMELIESCQEDENGDKAE